MLTVDELLAQAIAHARDILIDKPDASILPEWFVQFKNHPTTLIATPWGGESEKALMVFALRRLMRERGAISYSFMSEAWVAIQTPANKDLAPADCEDRGEVVMISACDSAGSQFRMYDIKRGVDARVTDLVLRPGWEDGRFEGRMVNLLVDDDD